VRDVPAFADRRDPPRVDVPPLRALGDRSALPALPEPAGRAVLGIRTRRGASGSAGCSRV